MGKVPEFPFSFKGSFLFFCFVLFLVLFSFVFGSLVLFKFSFF